MNLPEGVDLFIKRIDIDMEGRLPSDMADGDIEISNDEILRKLEEAEESFKAGRFYTEEEFFDKIEKLS